MGSYCLIAERGYGMSAHGGQSGLNSEAGQCPFVTGNPNSDIGVIRRPTRFVRLAAGVSELTITPEALLCGDPWRTWRAPPLGEMVLNR
jgi:hypothetical protein